MSGPGRLPSGGLGQLLPALAVAPLLLAFAFGGPKAPLGIAALILVLGWILWLAPKPPFHIFLPLTAAALALPQIAPAVHLFDLIAFAIIVLAIIVTLVLGDRRLLDVHTPGLLVGAMLTAPLLAVPFQVVSLPSFFGFYKTYLVAGLTFLALRRIVPADRVDVLLWAFPVFGLVGAMQLLGRVAELGARIGRLNFRTFYTDVGWGQANYIAAMLVLCLAGMAVLFVVDRRRPVRLLLTLLTVPMLQGFMVLFSRGATVALVVFVLVLLLGLNRAARIGVLAAAGLFGGLLLVSPPGQVLLMRFVDPTEMASVAVRSAIWAQSWTRFVEHPWTGIGLNQGRYQLDDMGAAASHNALLEVLSEQGIFGGVAYLAVVIAILRLAWRVVPSDPAISRRALRTVCLGLTLAMLANSMIEVTWQGYHHAVLMAFFAAWLTLRQPEAVDAAAARR